MSSGPNSNFKFRVSVDAEAGFQRVSGLAVDATEIPAPTLDLPQQMLKKWLAEISRPVVTPPVDSEWRPLDVFVGSTIRQTGKPPKLVVTARSRLLGNGAFDLEIGTNDGQIIRYCGLYATGVHFDDLDQSGEEAGNSGVVAQLPVSMLYSSFPAAAKTDPEKG